MTYTAIIKKSEGAYMVSFPDLPQVHTYGENIEEALKNAREALNGCLESDFERGFRLPISTKKTHKNGHPVEVEPHIFLAYQLRKIRNGLSQSEIARKLGISYQAYQKLENPRKCNPTIQTLAKISAVLNKTMVISFKN